MRNREDVLVRLRKACPLPANIFTNTVSPHFVYMDKDEKDGAVVIEMKVPVQTNSITDYLHRKVVDKAIGLMGYNLDLCTELEKICPFSAWRQALEELYV